MADPAAPILQPRDGAPLVEAGVRAPLIVIDDFLVPALAEAMRADIERHFAEPHDHRPETHQVWNYWFVPGLHTYLRTAPEKVIAQNRVAQFFDALKAWSILSLGLAGVTWPFLSLYVAGCREALHNDPGNGRFGFVYSLTRDERRTIGGETLVMREGDLFRSNLARPAAGQSFHEAVAPRFNRLIVFDDRLPHAVNPLEGSLDPVEGRLVLHGHLSEAETIVTGALPPAVAAKPLAVSLAEFAVHAAARIALYRGVLGLRLVIDRSGRVAQCIVLVDRVVHADGGDVEWEPLRQGLIEQLSGLKFPRASGETLVALPIVFGEPLSGLG